MGAKGGARGSGHGWGRGWELGWGSGLRLVERGTELGEPPCSGSEQGQRVVGPLYRGFQHQSRFAAQGCVFSCRDKGRS